MAGVTDRLHPQQFEPSDIGQRVADGRHLPIEDSTDVTSLLTGSLMKTAMKRLADRTSIPSQCQLELAPVGRLEVAPLEARG
ncbi:hypothetical protein [Mycobacterium persicum]|uniref:hypothetical protein n=1 Tax=Mycobacterium persicum TaxID=1487726 RepID=UPI000C08CABC|nr:hypothetical protein [Mycobacterium persicum]